MSAEVIPEVLAMRVHRQPDGRAVATSSTPRPAPRPSPSAPTRASLAPDARCREVDLSWPPRELVIYNAPAGLSPRERAEYGDSKVAIVRVLSFPATAVSADAAESTLCVAAALHALSELDAYSEWLRGEARRLSEELQRLLTALDADATPARPTPAATTVDLSGARLGPLLAEVARRCGPASTQYESIARLAARLAVLHQHIAMGPVVLPRRREGRLNG